MSDRTHDAVKSLSDSDSISTELSASRTSMSFQRTRMSADRTLMSVIRTSLSLISFGFTIYQMFSSAAASSFGRALVLLGTVMLGLGIAYHVRFMVELRRQRARMKSVELIHDEGRFPISLTLITAVALLVIGLFALASTVFSVG